jgi:hypothetical protein
VWKIPAGWHETVCTTIAATIALIVILLFAQDLEVQDEEEEEEEEHEHEHEEATANRDWNSLEMPGTREGLNHCSIPSSQSMGASADKCILLIENFSLLWPGQHGEIWWSDRGKRAPFLVPLTRKRERQGVQICGTQGSAAGIEI